MRNSDQSKFPNLGDMDGQLKTSKHDEIVIWMYEKLKDDNYLRNVLKIKSEVKPIISIEPRLSIDSYKSVYPDIGLYAKIKDKDSFNADGTMSYYFYFEIKTSINIGETIRQINHARQKMSYQSKTFWFVVAPVFPHYRILEEQGIGFIPYEP